MPSETLNTRPPFIFGYSLLLPVVWIIVGVLATTFVPGHRLGMVGTALMFMGVAALISLLFAKRHRRQFTNSEYLRIVCYSIGWALSIECFVILTVIVLPQIESGHVDAKPLLFAVPITVVLDAIWIWLAFRQTGRRVIAWHLRKLEPKETGVD